MDLILTGRPVNADEALQIGLANRVVETGTAREEAEKLAEQISAFPRECMLSDRQSVYEGFNMNFADAMEQEFLKGYEIVIVSGETIQGASKFTSGTGRHGKF
jgi:enoyl-CoA hydratase